MSHRDYFPEPEEVNNWHLSCWVQIEDRHTCPFTDMIFRGGFLWNTWPLKVPKFSPSDNQLYVCQRFKVSAAPAGGGTAPRGCWAHTFPLFTWCIHDAAYGSRILHHPRWESFSPAGEMLLLLLLLPLSVTFTVFCCWVAVPLARWRLCPGIDLFINLFILMWRILPVLQHHLTLLLCVHHIAQLNVHNFPSFNVTGQHSNIKKSDNDHNSISSSHR